MDVPDEDNQELQPDGSGWSFHAVASSADGVRLVASTCCPGPILTSADAGATWHITSAPVAGWRSVASSADGLVLLSWTASTANPLGSVYASTNGGEAWAVLTEAPIPVRWTAVRSSSDGRTLTAIGIVANQPNGIALVMSTNAGTSWRFTRSVLATTNDFVEVTVSSDGARLMARGYYRTQGPRLGEAVMYLSDDAGLSWRQATIPLAACRTYPQTGF